MIKYSIVIPCYNSFNKMENCLNMLERQKYKNFEVIIVDDCSKDNSYEMLNKYKNSSSMEIKLYKNEKNSGAGYTRNVGIKKSTGKFLLFIDSDDYVSEDILEIANSYLVKENIDCFVFDYFKCANKKNVKIDMIPYESHGFVDRNNAFKFIRGCTCGKIYRSDIVKKNNISFSNSIRNEDMPFTKVAISFCNKVFYYKEKPLYYYVMNDESLMHNNSLLDEENAFQAYKLVREKCNDAVKDYLEIVFIKECLYSMLSTMITKKYRTTIIKKKLSTISSDYPRWYKNTEIKKLGKVVNIILFLYKKSLLLPIRFIFFLKGVIYD